MGGVENAGHDIAGPDNVVGPLQDFKTWRDCWEME